MGSKTNTQAAAHGHGVVGLAHGMSGDVHVTLIVGNHARIADEFFLDDGVGLVGRSCILDCSKSTLVQVVGPFLYYHPIVSHGTTMLPVLA